MSYSQLTTMTSYSLLQSTIKIPQYVQKAKELGYQQLGITDVDNLYGAIEFYQECQKAGIKAIIGLNLYYYSPITESEHALFLFAKNFAGYQALMKLSSQKMITKQVILEEYPMNQNVFALLPIQNELSLLFEKDPQQAEDRLKKLQDIFGISSLFYGIPYQVTLSPTLESWFNERQIQPAAYQLIDSLEKEEAFSVQVLHHLKNGTQIENLREELQEVTAQKSLLAIDEKAGWYQINYPEAWQYAEKIANNCQLEIPLHQTLLPHYPLENQSAAEFLKELCLEQLPKRVPHWNETYQQRLLYELSVIHQMGFDDYFLIIWDVIAFAHQQKIVTGAGRGSAAGSLVAYVLSITDVDPIQYDLLFERFLNPERYTMPDIDLDIPDNRREELLLYVKNKYGQEHVAQIATFGTMAAKMVLRDVGRVFGLSQSEANRWSRAIPNKIKITLGQAYQESKALRELVAFNERNTQLYQVAQQLEGLPRHVSTHAAGVIISDEELSELIPLQEGSEEIWLTQFTMNDVETVGLLKMDFLGLRNLSIIDDTLKGIRKLTKKELTQKDIPLDDAKTLELFKRGETTGVFQFESAGIRHVLRRLQPETIDDIAAVNALYRPGPMQNIDTFIRRKQGKETIDFPVPELQPILENTYGIIVYQEQIMQVASQMAGFSLGQADILRRAISKKKKTVLDEQRRNFVSGSITHGYSEKTANEVYDYIERFADYGFNRSHAYAYSFVGFQMAFLKVHYPAAFFKALLQSVRHNPTKVKEYMNEAQKRRIHFLPPSINQSTYGFLLPSANEIRFGLGTIKGIRRDFLTDILADRKAQGSYTSLDQFLARMVQRNSKWLKEELIEPLIYVGAFDEIEPNRRQAIHQLAGKIQNVLYSGGSLELLDVMELKSQEIPDYTLEEKLDWEEKLLGIYLSGHPVQKFTKTQQWKKVQAIADIVENQSVRLLIYIKNIREIRTKKGEQMAFLEGNDVSGELSITVFPTLYRQIRGELSVNQVLYVEGKSEKSKFNGELQVLAQSMEPAERVEASLADQTCYLKVATTADAQQLMRQLSDIIKEYPGNVPVILFFEKDRKKQLLDEKRWIDYSDESTQLLKQLFGEENVVFR